MKFAKKNHHNRLRKTKKLHYIKIVFISGEGSARDITLNKKDSMNRFWFAGKYYYRAFYFKGSANSFSPQKGLF
ncbi:MAG: hypothetical protein IKS92_16575 [Victivallales bacterium]|nr:hypothetical protein [Victivallales bacterium]